MGNSLNNKNTAGIGKESLLNFQKISTWSLVSLHHRSRWSLPESLRTSHSFSSCNSKTKHQRSYSSRGTFKTKWPKANRDTIFLPHFKSLNKNNELTFENLIARGAYGIVFRVTIKDEKNRNIYALKILKKSKIIDEKAVEQIKNEIDIQKACSHHPFIVKYLNCWQNPGNLHILLEYIPCGELFNKITKFPYELIRFYIAEIAAALDFLHNAGIIYRDVKPENILLTKDFHIKLIDFGLSKWLKIGNKTKTMCGTFQYMAPEILLGCAYEHSVDWWALGVIACRMFTNKYPNTRKLIEDKHVFSTNEKNQLIIMMDLNNDDDDDLDDNNDKVDGQQNSREKQQKNEENEEKFLPKEVNSICKEGKDLLLRLLEYDAKQRIKSVMRLQRIAMYKDFKIEVNNLLKISPIEIMKFHNVLPETTNEDFIFNSYDEFKDF